MVSDVVFVVKLKRMIIDFVDYYLILLALMTSVLKQALPDWQRVKLAIEKEKSKILF